MRSSLDARACALATAIIAFTFVSCDSERGRSGLNETPARSYGQSAPSASESYPVAADSVAMPNQASKESSEEYDHITEHGFLAARANPLSTFSIDVDAAAYSNVRRMLNDGQVPDPDAVRIEEMINYFTYDYPQPRGNDPFSITTEVAGCPWNSEHKLVQIGIQGKRMEAEELPPNNLVFLIDVSGSMDEPSKLPLLKSALERLAVQLRPEDRLSIVVYAGAAGLVLPPTRGDQHERILRAIDNLKAGGSTAGGAGIELAYDIAQRNFLTHGNNRVILATDGDFNVGPSSEEELIGLIERKRETGVFLTVIGVGSDNLKDSKMEQLADKGNGHYAYIDSFDEATKVFVREMGATLYTIAKDVKIQVEFNPAYVREYRLIGYENRALAARDFNDDRKDAGELGAGHTVTALYEIVPAGASTGRGVDPLKYQQYRQYRSSEDTPAAEGGELMTVKLRYKRPKEDQSNLITGVVTDTDDAIEHASANLRFASAVAEWGMLLRHSEYSGRASFENVLGRARTALGFDPNGYRREFLSLVETSRRMMRMPM
ncbi:MAG: VWA domain-containing protein [Bacteroidetes bacterium]|nr:VWA domain-containing protein [Bacteroidota bacterium]